MSGQAPLSAEARDMEQVVVARFVRARHGHAVRFDDVKKKEQGPKVRAYNLPHPIALMLVRAYQLQRPIDAGEVKDQAALARELGISRARVTQLLDLTLLAPDIQEELLLMNAREGFEPINEHALRWVGQAREWAVQRRRWRELKA